MLLTECCYAYDTFWDHLHVCRNCHMPNPPMIEADVTQPLTLPPIDSLKDENDSQ